MKDRLTPRAVTRWTSEADETRNWLELAGCQRNSTALTSPCRAKHQTLREIAMCNRIEELLNKETLTAEEMSELKRLTCYGGTGNSVDIYEDETFVDHWDQQQREK